MSTRKLIVFKHASKLGNAPSHKLFDLITIEKNCGDAPSRSFLDYTVTVNEAPTGVELIEML
jgi:CRISPR-associated protein Csd2